jgi:hypothetical protein
MCRGTVHWQRSGHLDLQTLRCRIARRARTVCRRPGHGCRSRDGAGGRRRCHATTGRSAGPRPSGCAAATARWLLWWRCVSTLYITHRSPR